MAVSIATEEQRICVEQTRVQRRIVPQIWLANFRHAIALRLWKQKFT